MPARRAPAARWSCCTGACAASRRIAAGGGIALADVELLDPENYSQIVRAVLGPPYGSNAQGAHTLNSTEGIEIIDLVGPVKRVRSVRQ
jgi:hypothetical protein